MHAVPHPVPGDAGSGELRRVPPAGDHHDARAATTSLRSFSYVDPRQKVRTVDYVADKQGFHPILSHVLPEHPADSESVAQAKNRHYQLYAKIAEEHANPHPELISAPIESQAVAEARAKHAELFRVIAEQHARIAAEREALLREEEEKQQLQELGQ
ncbi:unnamed protein product [Spodoptera littoralis]|uniref:Cuticular protein n=1 Tax=Spodoptera littoralis TaxID=7109 RepID=A0A9P0I8L3_SPOLI|nr:unnamed protein product [Spodoptera littoralis]CAH1641336.1 unnamed protein product [Spodoptera littoralis]